ncbi:MFS transporter [Variovorax sp. dw_954]|uniref:MFS transporter n=1 Tax=Variovorax sp. dw_954 TaxID=2720078 RepID=UPI001BD68709|nr:MFS transporter [Variovorax sp. dw_954]
MNFQEKADARGTASVLTVLLMGVFIANVDVAVVNVATPSIREGLGASDSELQLVISAYTLSYAMLLVTGARLGATHGYRRLFMVGLGLFTLASGACGLAWRADVLIGTRVVQGIGAALLVPQVLTGIQLNFTGAARTRAIGYYALALSISAALGQVLGGALVAANLFGSGWRPIFLVNLPIGAVVMVAAWRILPVHREVRPQRLDLLGMGTLSLAVLLAVLPLMLGHTRHWPAWTWLSLIASVAPFVAFIIVERRIERRGGHPLVNLSLLAQRTIGWGLAAYGAALSTYFALLFTLALYLQEGLGESALMSGIALVSWVLAFGVGGLALSRLPRRMLPQAAPFGFVILAAAYGAVSVSMFSAQSSAALLFVTLGFGGFGTGVGLTAIIRAVTAAVPPRHASDMSGLISMTAQIAGVVGVAFFGTVYFSGAEAAGRAGATGAMHAFGIVATFFALTALMAAAAAWWSAGYSSASGTMGAISEL